MILQWLGLLMFRGNVIENINTYITTKHYLLILRFDCLPSNKYQK